MDDRRPSGWRGGILVALMLCGIFTGNAGAAGPADGFIYGTITTNSGNSHTGLIRWGDEEAFWDDVFHSAKEELPFAQYGRQARDEAADRWWKVLGDKIEDAMGMEPISRVFAARFGDIETIEVTGGSGALVTMRGGTTYRVSGYANDVGGTVTVDQEEVDSVVTTTTRVNSHSNNVGGTATVDDPAAGSVEIAWKNIKKITFASSPEGTEPKASRLFGTVRTNAGDFTGFIQWDEDECLSLDELDGDTEDGRMSIPLGTVASIEKSPRSGARVVLVDGRELQLDGTNDVDSSNRGVFIEDPRFGRVRVDWSAFRRLDLQTPDGSGRSYGDFDAQWRLRGTVTDTSGKRHAGAIVYDLDEGESWELFNGGHGGISYLIPFSRLSSLERRSGSSVLVTLEGGGELRLDEDQDVSKSNAGVVVIPDSSGEVFVPWNELRQIDFSR